MIVKTIPQLKADLDKMVSHIELLATTAAFNRLRGNIVSACSIDETIDDLATKIEAIAHQHDALACYIDKVVEADERGRQEGGRQHADLAAMISRKVVG